MVKVKQEGVVSDIDIDLVSNKGMRFTIADEHDVMGTRRTPDGRITTAVAKPPVKHVDSRESER